MPAHTDKFFTALAGASYINIAYREWGDASNPNVAICCHALERLLQDHRRHGIQFTPALL